MDLFPLTDDHIRHYREKGFVLLPDVLDDDELTDLRQAYDEANALILGAKQHTSSLDPSYERIFVQKVNLWTVHDGIKRHVLSPKLGSIANRLTGKPVRIWHDHALTKMPGDSRATAWHQDLPYWPMTETGALSCWTALEDVDETNGCMQFIPGSHRFGRFRGVDFNADENLFTLLPDKSAHDLTPFVGRMRAGSCTFHDALTFHYASPNTTDRPRRAMVTAYMPDGTTFNGARHVVTDDLGLKKGQKLEGAMFPIACGATAAS